MTGEYVSFSELEPRTGIDLIGRTIELNGKREGGEHLIIRGEISYIEWENHSPTRLGINKPMRWDENEGWQDSDKGAFHFRKEGIAFIDGPYELKDGHIVFQYYNFFFTLYPLRVDIPPEPKAKEEIVTQLAELAAC